MTSNQLISDIRNIASSGSNPIDFRIEDSQILFWCNEIRSKLIAQALQKGQDISTIWGQTITCLNLIEVDEAECCSVTTGCKVLRTELPIPNTIETRGDNTFITVTKPNGDFISKTNSTEYKYIKYNKYTSKRLMWFLYNGYIYIINDLFLESINIYAIFEDPSELSNYVSCDGDTCFSIDSPYPCSLKMADDITNIVLKTKVYPFIQMPQDNTNDANNNLPGSTKINNS